jgi:hypothetical protein
MTFGSTAEIGELLIMEKDLFLPICTLSAIRFLIVMLQEIQHEPEIP